MGRKSLAEKMYEQFKDSEPGDATWLIVYDFPGKKPSTKFYENLHRIKSLGTDGQLIRSGVYKTGDIRVTITLQLLIKHYGGEVTLFRVEQKTSEKAVNTPPI